MSFTFKISNIILAVMYTIFCLEETIRLLSSQPNQHFVKEYLGKIKRLKERLNTMRKTHRQTQCCVFLVLQLFALFFFSLSSA